MSGRRGNGYTAAIMTLAMAVAACGLEPDPPPQIPTQAYGGMGDRMADCMQYGSESYCEREVWGGHER